MNSPVSPGLIDLTREPNFRLGAIEIRPATREVIAGGEREMLEPRVMQVLVALSRRRDEVISRDELIMSCWAGRMVGDDAINRCIGRVRRLSETYGGFALETIPRIGYRLLEKASAPESAQDVIPHEEHSRVENVSAWTRKRRQLLALAALLLVLAGGGYWMLRPSQHDIAVRPPAKFSIAVLSFTSYSGDRESEQLANAVSAGIADMLSRIGCDVVAPTESMQFHGASKAGAAKALHAAIVIDGELHRERDTIVVSVRLVDGNDGTMVRAETYQWPAAEAETLPDFVATEIANYGWLVINSFTPHARWNQRVMAGSLKVMKLLTERRDTNRRDTPNAFQVARDIAVTAPDDAFAQMLLGWTMAQLIPDAPLNLRAAIARDAHRFAEQAIRLDPQYGDPYAVLSEATPTFNWAVREDLLRRGIAVQPISLAYLDLVEILQNTGRLAEAGRMTEGAYGRDPYLADVVVKTINSRIWLGQQDAARSLLERSQVRHPNSNWFAGKMFEATAFRGELDAADALLKRPAIANLIEPGVRPMVYRHTLAALRRHKPADIQNVVNDCANATSQSLEFRRTCLLALVALGRLNEAFPLAERLYPDQRGATPAEIEQRWLSIGRFATAYLVIPATAPLRADPRYRNLVERVGLLQFWKERHVTPDFCAVEKAPVCAELKS